MNSKELPTDLSKKVKKLTAFFKNKRVIVAFSGGIDSTLLAYLSKKYAQKTLLLTASSVLFSEEELTNAKEFSKSYSIEHEIVDIDPMTQEDFVKNPPNRCYVCKKQIFSEFRNIQQQRGFDTIVEGSNLSELSEHRPGFKAIEELGISTPYVKYEINKEEIRKLCQYFNLGSCNRPPNACFASRIAYNIPIEESLLQKIKKAEKFLKNTFDLDQVRVRYHEQDLARIEFLLDDLFRIFHRDNIDLIKTRLTKLGFKYITVDLEGYVSGSMNKNIEKE